MPMHWPYISVKILQKSRLSKVKRNEFFHYDIDIADCWVNVFFMYPVTATLLNFVKLFRTACEENIKQAEEEKKRAMREAEMQKEKEKEQENSTKKRMTELFDISQGIGLRPFWPSDPAGSHLA